MPGPRQAASRDSRSSAGWCKNDGFVAGPGQSRDHPLGRRGIELHGWHIGDLRATEADKTATGWLMRPRGAYVMGRNMFGPIRGEWNELWDGWWGSEPPYHSPVFVLTHHAHETIEMEGGTTFHFVTEGFDGIEAFGFEPFEVLHSPLTTHVRYRRRSEG